jgi:hypothetical protein
MGIIFGGDIERIVRVCARQGVLISRDQAQEAWEAYSDSLSAQWMILPSRDDTLFLCIEDYLPGGGLAVGVEDESVRCQKCHDGPVVPGFAYCPSCTRETLDWVRQTVHRAYHGEHSLDSCPKDTCGAIRKLLGDQ